MFTAPLIRRLVLVLLLFTANPLIAQQTPETDALRVATYNIENAFDVYDDPYTKDEGTRVKPRWQYESIAGALKAIDADVIGFQEVENEQVLQALVDEYLPGMGYDHVAVPLTNDERGIKLGLVSRLPIQSITSYRWQTLTLPDSDETWRFARDLMHARLILENGDLLNVFVVHLKSKGSREGDPQSVNWRSSEARRLRTIIESMLKDNPDERILVIGDFNSNPKDPAMTALLETGTDGDSPLADSHVLIPNEDRTTYPSDRFPNTIFDYILTSPKMTDALAADSAKVFNDPNLTRGSDHYPVYADFVLSK